MMLPFISLGFALSLAVAQPPAAPQTTAPILQQRFNGSTEGWVGVGDSSKVTSTSTPRAALVFEYKLDKTTTSLLARPMEMGLLKGAQQLTFSLRADTATTIAVIVQEHDGGRFTATVRVPKDTWQSVVLAPSDFTLGRDPGDPKDDNGRLDIEKADGMAVADLAQYFIKMEDNPTLKFLSPGITAGQRKLELADLVVLGGTPLTPSLDGLARPQLGWITMGHGATATRETTGSPLGVPSLALAYEVGAQKAVGMLRPIPVGALVGKAALGLTVAAAKSTTLIVQLEDDQGGKFMTSVEVPGLKTPRKLTLTFTDFQPTDDSREKILDLARVKQVLFLDLTGLTENVEQSNTLWLAGMNAK